VRRRRGREGGRAGWRGILRFETHSNDWWTKSNKSESESQEKEDEDDMI